jgi:hypothetical protein
MTALVRLGAGAQVLTVDGPDVATADRGRLHPQQHLTVSRLRHVDRDLLDGAVAGQADAGHLGHLFSSVVSGRAPAG